MVKKILIDILLPLALVSLLYYAFYTFMEGKRQELQKEIVENGLTKQEEKKKLPLSFEEAVRDTFYEERIR